jgi:hypothetical protein
MDVVDLGIPDRDPLEDPLDNFALLPGSTPEWRRRSTNSSA